MSENKITIIAESFEAAALEFHRSKLSSKGYRMDGKITSQKFEYMDCLLYTSPSPRDGTKSRMPSSA